MELMDKYKTKRDAIKKKYGERVAPSDRPVFPGKLSKLSDDELLDLMGKYAEWLAFASVEAGEADADRKFTENLYKRLKRERADKLAQELTASGKELKKHESDTITENDPTVMKMYDQFVYKESVFRLEESYRMSFENLMFVLSRDLTRRMKSQEGSVRRERHGYGDNTGADDLSIYRDDD